MPFKEKILEIEILLATLKARLDSPNYNQELLKEKIQFVSGMLRAYKDIEEEYKL